MEYFSLVFDVHALADGDPVATHVVFAFLLKRDHCDTRYLHPVYGAVRGLVHLTLYDFTALRH